MVCPSITDSPLSGCCYSRLFYKKRQQRFNGLGLSESDVHSIIVYTGCLVNSLENMLNEVDERYINFIEFQQWLQYGTKVNSFFSM